MSTTDITLSRTLPASVGDVAALLTPASIIRLEGRDDVADSTTDGETTVVTAKPFGRLVPRQYVFEAREDGFAYRSTAVGSFATVETRLTLRARGDETELRLRSRCEPTVPVPVFRSRVDRYLASRRRRTLERFCDRLRENLPQ